MINGFAKSVGLLQIEELGTLESPIAMTNTLSVGTVQQTLVKYMLEHHPEIGTLTGTINAVVTECNDAYLNDIRACAITPQDVLDAIASRQRRFCSGRSRRWPRHELFRAERAASALPPASSRSIRRNLP